jgi:inhibitor of cysteine peptidase
MDEPTLQLDQRADGRDFRLGLGHQLELVLPENPTTGYRWYLGETGSPALALVQDRIDTAGGPPGQGGSRHWVFKAVQPGNAEIRAVYRRSWESEGTGPRSFRMVVMVVSR